GGPEGQPLVAAVLAATQALGVLGTSFVADRGSLLEHQLRIERGRETDRLRKNGRRTCTGHTMQRLVPPVISGYAEAGNRRRSILQLRNLLLQRHARDQVRRPFLKAVGGIPIDRPARGTLTPRQPRRCQQDYERCSRC